MNVPPGLLPAPSSSRFSDRVEGWEDVAGMAFAKSYGDALEEYASLRSDVVAIDYSILYKWFVRGADAVRTVDSVFSRDLGRIRPGRVAYGVVVDPAGMMIEDITVLQFDAEHVLVMGGNPLTGEQLARIASDKTTIAERRQDYAVLSLQGPKSRELLSRLTQADISNRGLPYYSFLSGVVVADVPVTILRLGFTAELGYELMVDAPNADRLWDAVLAQSDLGVTPMGLEALLVARTEAGMVVADLDYDRETTPFECGLGWTLDLESDFQGAAALRQAKGRSGRRLVSLVLEGPAQLQRSGALLIPHPCEVRVADQVVGVVTTGVQSPALGGASLALARVDEAFAVPGRAVEVLTDEGLTSATVHATPIYDPQRVKAKS